MLPMQHFLLGTNLGQWPPHESVLVNQFRLGFLQGDFLTAPLTPPEVLAKYLVNPITAQYSPVQSITAKHNPVQSGTAHWSPVQSITAKHSPVHSNTDK